MSHSPRIDAVLGQLAAEGRELSKTACPQALVDEARRIEGELGQVMAIFVRLKSTYETESRGAQNAMRMIRELLEVDDGSEVLNAIGRLKDEVAGLRDRIKRLELAGDVLETCTKYSCTRDMETSAVQQWRKAKEANP